MVNKLKHNIFYELSSYDLSMNITQISIKQFVNKHKNTQIKQLRSPDI